MRATITVYGEQGSGKTNWLDQLKRALLATTPAEAVEVTAFETHREPGTSRHVSEQFDEFTIPAADADGTAGVAGDRETWSVKPLANGHWRVDCGDRPRAGFVHRADAELFATLKSATPDQWQAIVGVLDRASFHFNGDRPFWTGGPVSENCKGGEGEFAERAGAIPPAVYWHDTVGNFISWWTEAPLSATFYRAWAARRTEFPQSRHECNVSKFAVNRQFGKLSAAEAPAIHDGWPTPMVPRAQRDELAAKLSALEAKLRNVISHATGGSCQDTTLSLNDICVRITASRNKVYAAGQRRAAMEALRRIADIAGVILPKTLADVTSDAEQAS